MLSFTKKNPTVFTGQRFEYPMLFALFKLLGGTLCLFANTMILIRSDNIEDVIKDYVAVQVISEIDNIMAGTVPLADKYDMKVFISRKQMQVSDRQIWANYISCSEEDEDLRVHN